jgi:hypothetical protein
MAIVSFPVNLLWMHGIVRPNFPGCIRPFLFENDDVQWRFSLRGSCFLVGYDNRTFAITAKHVVRDYRPSQYRIPKKLGSHEMLPIRQPFTVELHFEDFEDFVVVPIDSAEVVHPVLDENDVSVIDEGTIRWNAIRAVAVFGFPSGINSVDYDQALISIQPCGMVGHLTANTIGEGMREIQMSAGGELESYDGFSGAPVFHVSDSGSIERLLGIVLRGSLSTRTSQRCHFLDIRVVPALIRRHLADSENCPEIRTK